MKTCNDCGIEKSKCNTTILRNGSLNSYCHKCSARRSREYAKSNPDKVRERHRIYRSKNRDKIRKWDAQWKINHPDRLIYYRRERRRHRRSTIPSVRIANAISNRVRRALKGKYKSARTIELLGCSIDNFKMYLESRFEPGMTWDNYGKVWHIDHIIPCAIFDLSRPEHQSRCFHFSNLRPMLAVENMRKSAKIITNQFNLL